MADRRDHTVLIGDGLTEWTPDGRIRLRPPRPARTRKPEEVTREMPCHNSQVPITASGPHADALTVAGIAIPRNKHPPSGGVISERADITKGPVASSTAVARFLLQDRRARQPTRWPRDLAAKLLPAQSLAAVGSGRSPVRNLT